MKTKAEVKQLYDFLNKWDKIDTRHIIVDGIKVSFDVFFGYLPYSVVTSTHYTFFWEPTLDYTDVSLSSKVQSTSALLDRMYEPEDAFSDEVQDEINTLQKRMLSEWTPIYKNWGAEALHFDIHKNNKLISFEDFYKRYSTMKVPPAPKTDVIVLNGSYTAKISSDSKEVTVGCQKIPITRIREVVESYDRLTKS